MGSDSLQPPKVVVSEWLPEGELDRLRSRFDLEYASELFAEPSSLVAMLEDAAAVIVRNRTQLTASVIAAASQLRIIGRLGAGLDNIDTDAAAGAGIRVVSAAGVNAVSVAEYVIGAMITLRRPVFSLTSPMTSGQWPRQGHAFGHELAGGTLGLVGFGAIGREVARRAAALQMRVLAHDPYAEDATGAEMVELDRLLAASDVISLHAALTPETTGLIDADRLALVKPTAVLINTSRGGVLDEVALANALHDGRLAGAALDVFVAEPLGAEAGGRFAGLDNVILTPHVSGNTEESVARVSRTIVDAVIDHLAE